MGLVGKIFGLIIFLIVAFAAISYFIGDDVGDNKVYRVLDGGNKIVDVFKEDNYDKYKELDKEDIIDSFDFENLEEITNNEKEQIDELIKSNELYKTIQEKDDEIVFVNSLGKKDSIELETDLDEEKEIASEIASIQTGEESLTNVIKVKTLEKQKQELVKEYLKNNLGIESETIKISGVLNEPIKESLTRAYDGRLIFKIDSIIFNNICVNNNFDFEIPLFIDDKLVILNYNKNDDNLEYESKNGDNCEVFKDITIYVPVKENNIKEGSIIELSSNEYVKINGLKYRLETY